LVSVIIASYNHADYIEACIESVLAQTYRPIELRVIDDGSVDDSVQRISRLQSRHGFDFRIQKNQGLSRTLNAAIEAAQGALIVPFGSDDVMLPDRIGIQVAYLAGKPEVGICAGGIQEIDATGKELGPAESYGLRRLDFEDIFLDRKRGAPAPSLMFRREALEAVGGFDPEIRLEDLYIQLRIARAGYFVDVLDEVLALYRVHGRNTYKNHRFMVDNVLKTYARFDDHPACRQVKQRFINAMVLKCARQDKTLARQLLAQLPISAWNAKTLRAVFRLLLTH
jgi:alpha-1,3-rhamnosyltransferase